MGCGQSGDENRDEHANTSQQNSVKELPVQSNTSNANKEESGEEMKLVILGNGGVGKSAITFRFVQNKFVEQYSPTIEDSFRKARKVDGKNFMLDILDTAGQEEYTELRELYMRGGEGFLLVFSIIDKKSFLEASNFLKLIKRVKDSEKVPVVLVGNKADLEKHRLVSRETGENQAKEWNAPYFETSAALGTNCDEAFDALCREILKKRASKP